MEPAVGETQCESIVAGIATGEIEMAVEDAYGKFFREFSDLVEPSWSITRETYQEKRRPPRRQENQAVRRRFDTVIKRSIAFGVNIKDILVDPIGAAHSACLFEFARLDLPPQFKPRKSMEAIAIAKGRLLEELAKPVDSQIPSLSGVANELGVSVGFLSYRLSDLVKKYTKRRRSSLERAGVNSRLLAIEVLRNGIFDQYPSRLYPSQDHVVRAVIEKADVGVHTARVALSKLLQERRGRDVDNSQLPSDARSRKPRLSPAAWAKALGGWRPKKSTQA